MPREIDRLKGEIGHVTNLTSKNRQAHNVDGHNMLFKSHSKAYSFLDIITFYEEAKAFLFYY